jgi:hypothetical protein
MKLEDEVDPKLPEFSRHAPLRLDVALKAAFPAGGITIAGLRKEIAKGRLEVELIAGKQFTTLDAIQRMRELCRVVPKDKPEMPTQRDVLSIHASQGDQSGLQRLVNETRQRLRTKGNQKTRKAKNNTA